MLDVSNNHYLNGALWFINLAKGRFHAEIDQSVDEVHIKHAALGFFENGTPLRTCAKCMSMHAERGSV